MRIPLKLAFALAFVVPTQIRAQQPATKVVDFGTEIQPILTKNCKACHQGGAAPAGLRMDSPAALLQGSISGKVVIAGHAQESLLVKKITNQSGLGMPPSGPLSDDQIAVIVSWIDQGAKIPDSLLGQQAPAAAHWAYVKPVRPAASDGEEHWVEPQSDRPVCPGAPRKGRPKSVPGSLEGDVDSPSEPGLERSASDSR